VIICRTPFRISFFGGGTDYPAWYRVHGGAVLAATINKYCYISCRYLPPFFEHRIRVVWSKIETCQTIEEVTHPAVRAVLGQMGVDRGVEIHHDGDLPSRSGIGSSSAFTVGLLHAIHELNGRRRQLRIIKDMVDESISLLNGGRDLAGFGELLHEGWQAKRELSPLVSNPEIEDMYEAARAAGAIGGKLLGAGGGGFLLL